MTTRSAGACRPGPDGVLLCDGVVEEAWVDYNGHMEDGYYAVAFAGAANSMLDHLGLGEAYLAATGCTIYTVEAHLRFLREVRGGAPLRFAIRILGVDAKRIHLFYSMLAPAADDGDESADTVLATMETMSLHIDQRTGRASPLPGDRRVAVEGFVALASGSPTPEGAGRAISMPGPNTAVPGAAAAPPPTASGAGDR